ncbi:phosphodiesterase [Sulfitobacter sp. JBTF-M27]|uniref:Phosphodiesterase n=1 Tax=Sulfitobacter sediminilitoris TaxID=2698830 RepID=A0A6P0CH13_9RHOB|nr:metallophosphoesterase [Sulfitobacter sediminilitoris]NEK23754.1 phosphodiesterase [Sulfitobacter sediminilitoris]
MTRIIHLTDLHISHPDVGDAALKTDTTDTLRRAVAAINAMDPLPDLVVASGDLTNTGAASSYGLLQEILADLAPPVVLALGNHDKRTPFAEVFATGTGDAPFMHERILGNLHVITLDTLVPGHVAGRLDPGQIAFLDTALEREPDLPKLVVAHHPPRMDDRTLPWASLDEQSSDRFGETIAGRGVIGVLSGHVHLDQVHHWHGVPVITCMGLNSTVDILEQRDMRIVEGTSMGLCVLRPSGLSVSFVPLTPERRQLGLLEEARLRAFK